MKRQTTLPQTTRLRGSRPTPGAGFRLGLLLLVWLASGLLAHPAGAQSVTWATKTTLTAEKTAVTPDGQGNSFVLTAFTGTVAVGGRSITSLGGTDLLLTKYDPQGKVIWARRIGGTGNEKVGDVTVWEVDPGEGNVYLAGSFQSTVQVESVEGTSGTQLTSAGGYDMCIVKYFASTGRLMWAKRAGGTGNDYANGIDMAGSSTVVTGSFTGTIKFPVGNATYFHTGSGSSDILLASFDWAGNYKWSRKLGGAGRDMGMAVSVSKTTGDIYVTGGYAPAADLYNTNVFVARYSAAGNLLWNKISGSAPVMDMGNDIVAMPDGAYVTGYFGGSISFGGAGLGSKGSADAFLAFYPTIGNGTASWAKQFGSSGWDEGQSLACKNWGNNSGAWELYLGGTFTGTATFGSATLNAQGGSNDQDLFIAHLLANGSPAWAKRIGSTNKDLGRGNVAVGWGNNFSKTLYVTGHYGTTTALGNTTLNGYGNLLARLDPPTVIDYSLINATTDKAIITSQTFSPEINYMLLGTKQINIRANALDGSTGSVKFVLDGVEKIDNAAPFTWAGDAPVTGGTDYLGFTPAVGKHTLLVTPYSGPNGTGAKGTTRQSEFTVLNKPSLTGLTLINAVTDGEVKTLENGGSVNYLDVGSTQINVRANTNPGTVGSVQFVLDGVARTENAAPYTLAGDVLKTGGGYDYKPLTLAPGTYRLVVTAYSDANATGTASAPLDITFTVSSSGYRVAARNQPAAETPAPAFTAAPNPFSHRTSLFFTAAEDGPATVEVCNAQGLSVQRLFEGTLHKGQAYSWQFDGTAQPAGLYVARLKVGHQVLHQRLVRTK
ncbi:MAG: hypothetical protein ICV83_07805 [Cytophagales bacterium]|nr:hypothetical protein [Cytophagales bacterium]